MGTVDNKAYEVEYEKWGAIVIRAQLIIAVIVCAIEVLNNMLLFCTKSQGYGPDTIVEKLIRYLCDTDCNQHFVRRFQIIGDEIWTHQVTYDCGGRYTEKYD